MPNIAGVMTIGGVGGDFHGELDQLDRLLQLEGVTYTTRRWCDERFAALNMLHGLNANLDQPAVSADGERVLFLDGEIYNLPELIPLLPDPGSVSARQPAQACLALYDHLGEDLASRLNGQFNVVVYDKPQQCLRMFNDRVADRPMYYAEHNGRLVFALEKKAVIALTDMPIQLDRMGILEFFTFGHNLQDRTVFTHISALPQACVLTYDGNGLRMRKYWKPGKEDKENVPSLNGFADEWGKRLIRAMERRMQYDRPELIFLSGGLDSRTVAGAMSRVRQGGVAVTFGGFFNTDMRYAIQLAKVLGLDHHRLSYEGVSYFDALPRVVWRTEASFSFEQTISIMQHPNIYPLGTRHLRGTPRRCLHGRACAATPIHDEVS